LSDCPETGFEEPWAGSAFDGSKLPTTGLLDNLREGGLAESAVAQDYVLHQFISGKTTILARLGLCEVRGRRAQNRRARMSLRWQIVVSQSSILVAR